MASKDKSWIEQQAKTRSTQESLRRMNRGKLDNALVPREDGTIQYKRFQVLSAGLVIPDDATDEELNDIANALATVDKSIQWAVGDLVNKMREKHPDLTYEQIADAYGYSASSLMIYTSVCKSFPIYMRHIDLFFGHHHAVQSMDEEQRKFWLAQAIENSWTEKELKDAIAVARNNERRKRAAVMSDRKIKRIVNAVTGSIKTKFGTDDFLDSVVAFEGNRETLLDELNEAALLIETVKQRLAGQSSSDDLG